MQKKICEISSPKQWKTISSDMLQTDGYPVYGANGIIGYYHEYNHKCETLLITCRGATCGALNICQPYSYVNGNAMALDNLSDDVDIKYLYYYLLNRGLSDVITGSAQPQIVRQSLDKVVVEYPVLNKQKEIVDNLNNIEELISYRKEQLNKLDELVKSRFIEMFGDPVINPKSWEIAPLSSLIVTANNGMARRGKDNDGSIVLRLVELQNGYIDYAEPNRISLTEAEEKRYRLKENDFLFARVNGNPDYVGRCAVFNEISEPVYHNDHIIRVHFDESKINGCFTSVLLNSDYGKRQIREQIKTSAGQYTISQDGIGAIMTILPPLDLQNKFSTFVEQTDKLKFEVKEALEKLETLKKSLMQQYFG